MSDYSVPRQRGKTSFLIAQAVKWARDPKHDGDRVTILTFSHREQERLQKIIERDHNDLRLVINVDTPSSFAICRHRGAAVFIDEPQKTLYAMFQYLGATVIDTAGTYYFDTKIPDE